jgi:hypothetical protein
VDEQDILQRIDALVEEEHHLRSSTGDPDPADRRERLQRLEQTLDQCWDLLRQRRAKAEFGENPDEAQARPISEVESYRQ